MNAHSNMNSYQFAHMTPEKDVHIYTALDEHGTHVGQAQLSISGRSQYLDSLHVADGYRGRGAGTALVDHVLSQHGSRAVSLEASPYGMGEGRLDHEQLAQMYAKHGFTPQADGTMKRKGRR
jgi:GNAT superfamily N-acetyltransferase